jgi:hypothetical protein
MAKKDVRLLAYSMSVDRVRAVELRQGTTIEHDFGSSMGLLDQYDAVQGELTSPSMLSLPMLPALERFASVWGRSLLPGNWLSDPPEYGLIIPHALLHGLPLHVVRADSGRPICTESAISVCSSLTLLKRCMQRSPRHNASHADLFLDEARREPAGWLIGGVDTLGKNDDAWSRMPAELLKGCGENVDVEDSSHPYSSLRDFVSAFLSGRSYELIILAAHGYRDPLDAFNSGLLLRQNDTGFKVRPLDVLGRDRDELDFPYVIQDLPVREVPAYLNPRVPTELLSYAELEHAAHIVCPLVALLGCSTGRAVLYPGDQPMSMAEIFLRIGASSVLAPMWDVTLTAVRAWMGEFLLAYRVGGEARAEAARIASRKRYDAGASLHEAGCLVLHGDYR